MTHKFVIAKGPFRPPPPARALLRLLQRPEQALFTSNCSVPGVQPLQSPQTVKPRMGLSSRRVYAGMYHFHGMSFGEDALGEDRAVKVGGGLG